MWIWGSQCRTSGDLQHRAVCRKEHTCLPPSSPNQGTIPFAPTGSLWGNLRAMVTLTLALSCSSFQTRSSTWGLITLFLTSMTLKMELTHSSIISGSLRTTPTILTICSFKTNLITILWPTLLSLPPPPPPKVACYTGCPTVQCCI
jgi:hypothetical protein